ncbi:glutamate/gamma-aminobutyrate family transporter YjeM [Vagococcus jeotgali]|uniref:glutamate/gamma-aminobutyrate family transporter YjeM n=1 Tax=Vagococcus jeotgali TaxID=3109030 RepID=UPI002DD8784B|nr:glutamate/gamma-aminobutyrate family transporter YjeM [Vagococcus sp. B2T-5]
MSNQAKKMSLIGLILMIFTSVFGFGNAPVAFYRMGYGAIIWYILAALFFFIPYALMMAEYGSAFKTAKGGMFTWMEKSVGAKYAFIGTFMWYTSYIIWMVSVAPKIFITLSTTVSGSDHTGMWSLFGMNSTETVGLLAIIFILIVTFFSSKGLDKITKITSAGGIAVMSLNVILIVISLIILVFNGGELAQPIEGAKSFIVSPNAGYTTPLATISFLVFAIFAYGGLEAVGGLVDKTENAEKNFPKGIILSALVISIGYALTIFLWGVSTNWDAILGGENVNLGNITYVLMNNLGYKFGTAIHLSEATAITIGNCFARFTGLTMFLAYLGAFFTLSYSPLKTIIEGTPKGLWPEKMVKTNDKGMPEFSMWVQGSIVVLILLLVSFGGKESQSFYNILTLMTNVSMTIPYIFLAGAFPAFKKKDSIDHSFSIYKTKTQYMVSTIIVVAVIGFANIFTIIEPLFREGGPQWGDTLWQIAGPVLFSIIALILFKRYENKVKNGKIH